MVVEQHSFYVDIRKPSGVLGVAMRSQGIVPRPRNGTTKLRLTPNGSPTAVDVKGSGAAFQAGIPRIVFRS